MNVHTAFGDILHQTLFLLTFLSLPVYHFIKPVVISVHNNNKFHGQNLAKGTLE